MQQRLAIVKAAPKASQDRSGLIVNIDKQTPANENESLAQETDYFHGAYHFIASVATANHKTIAEAWPEINL